MQNCLRICNKKQFLSFLVFFLIFLCSFAFKYSLCNAQILSRSSASFHFSDDADKDSLARAIQTSIDYVKKKQYATPYTLCGRQVGSRDILESLHHFYKIVKNTDAPEELAETLYRDFEVCLVTPDMESPDVLVTGYFEPLLDGSLEKRSPFLYPLYKVPPDLIVNHSASLRYGRQEGGRILPYWTRKEIETAKLLVGQELVFLADPIEAFILHIQGSGRVRLRDGRIRGVHFAAKNGRPYKSIGRLLADEGKMALATVTLPRIVKYLEEHPEDRQRILHHNESFVFFKWGDSGPVGSIGRELTPGRSVAMDQSCFPPGALFYLETQKPVVDEGGNIEGWIPLNRFVLNQDSGSAIKGFGRVDFFWGNGSYAEIAAGVMKEAGKVYFLLKK